MWQSESTLNGNVQGKYPGAGGEMQKEGPRIPWFYEVSPSRQPLWGHPRLSFIWTVEVPGMTQKGFLKLGWGRQIWLGGEESSGKRLLWEGLYLGCSRKSCLLPSCRWACHCYPHCSYQSRKLYRGLWMLRRVKILPHSGALSVLDSETSQMCSKMWGWTFMYSPPMERFPWKLYCEHALTVHAKSLPHVHSHVSLDSREAFCQCILRTFCSGSIMECM